MGSHDSRQSFEKTACCGKVSHRVANTVIYLCGRTGLILPRGPKSLQAHLQPASAVKFMRWRYRILIHWKNIFQVPKMGSKLTRKNSCGITCLSLPPLCPSPVFAWEVESPSWSHLSYLCGSLHFLRMPLAQGLHEWNVPVLSWSQPARGDTLRPRTRITTLLEIL